MVVYLGASSNKVTLVVIHVEVGHGNDTLYMVIDSDTCAEYGENEKERNL